jgi:hypothetical protein
LAGLPAARQIRSLEFDFPSGHDDPTRDHGVEGLRALAASSHLAALQRLSIHSHRIGAAGLGVIAQSPAFANLTHLALTDPALRDVGNEPVLQLVNAPHLAGLVQLRVADMTFGAHLLRSMRWGGRGQTGSRGPTA